MPSRFGHNEQSGLAAIIALVIIMSVTLAIAMSAVLVSYTNQRTTRISGRSSQSYYLAEAGMEDSLLRIMDPDLSHDASNTLTLGGHTATISIAQVGDELTVESEGNVDNYIRTVSLTAHENTTGGSFFYGIQVDEGGLLMSNNARVNGNVQ